MKLIEFIEVKRVFGEDEGKVEALRGINLSVEKGEMIAIMGPSGSGKSTLLNIIGFLDKATDGIYKFNGEESKKLSDRQLAKKRNEYIGFVVQNFALIDDYTIFQNIKVPLDYAKINKKEKKERIEKLLKKMGILDKKTGNDIMTLFKELNKNGKTVIIITHDENVAKQCQRTIYIEDGLVRRKKN